MNTRKLVNWGIKHSPIILQSVSGLCTVGALTLAIKKAKQLEPDASVKDILKAEWIPIGLGGLAILTGACSTKILYIRCKTYAEALVDANKIINALNNASGALACTALASVPQPDILVPQESEPVVVEKVVNQEPLEWFYDVDSSFFFQAKLSDIYYAIHYINGCMSEHSEAVLGALYRTCNVPDDRIPKVAWSKGWIADEEMFDCYETYFLNVDVGDPIKDENGAEYRKLYFWPPYEYKPEFVSANFYERYGKLDAKELRRYF